MAVASYEVTEAQTYLWSSEMGTGMSVHLLDKMLNGYC